METGGELMKVLVVEDSQDVVETIKICLALRWPESVVIDTSHVCEVAGLVETEHPDLVLLDLNLGDEDGLEALHEFQQSPLVPTIIISGRTDELSKIRGLELGADDYLVKPFSNTELLARVNAVMRRSTGRRQLESSEVSVGPLTVDLAKRRVHYDGEPVALTATEWGLLSFLVENQGKIMSTQALASAVWGSRYVEGSTIRMCIRRLRLKIHDDTERPVVIRSHRGVGYSFELT